MTPDEIFHDVSECLFIRLKGTLRDALDPVLRQFPGVWDQCVKIAAAVDDNDTDALSEELHELDLLVSSMGWDYHFPDLQFKLEGKMKNLSFGGGSDTE